MKPLLICAAILALTGCTSSVTDATGPAASGYPSGSKRIETIGGYVYYIIPVKMDGADCFVVTKNSAGGPAISCNFKETK